jgi:hypothetical protein
VAKLSRKFALNFHWLKRVFTVGDLKLLIYATTVETRIVGDLGKLFRSFLSALCFLILFGKGAIKNAVLVIGLYELLNPTT